MSADVETIAPPEVKKKKDIKKKKKPLHIPQYHVVLLDDNDHTYDYVIEMLMQIFRHSRATAFRMACEVDTTGRVIVETTTKERAELKRDQIHAYGPDWRLPHSQGSMSALIEPAGANG
ncbi:MAG: ATP-dependent Clp protease adaptor ClpS [bacterium]